MKSLLNRRSVRAFKSDALPREALEQIVYAGKLAPSAMNKQQYHITVVTSAEKLQLLSDLAKQEMLSNPGLPPHIKEKIDSPDFNGVNHAPAMIIVSSYVDNRDSDRDAALVCENLMIAARSLDIGSCWLGAFSMIGRLEGIPELLHKELAIPDGMGIYGGIVFGYPKDGFPTTERVRKDDNVNWVE